MSAIDTIRTHYDNLHGQEAWRYTSLRGLSKQNLVLAAPANTVGPLPRLLPESIFLVLVNGVFAPGASDPLPKGISFDTVAPPHTQDTQDPLTPHRQSGLALNITGTDHPVIEILHLVQGHDGALPLVMPHHSITLAKGADAVILDHHTGTGGYALHQHVDIKVPDQARLRHYRIQNESLDAWHLSHIDADIARDATYENFTLSLGARLSRNEIHLDLAGENAETHLNSAYLLRGQQHADTTSKIDHRVPHGRSNQTCKGVIADHGRGVFQGKIHVHPQAQKTDGYQLNQALLLSDHAEINSKPELEIYADDVKCSHGATVGQLDRTALFYLRSRGIPESSARALLVQSFLGTALDLITDQTVQGLFYGAVEQWLSQQNA